MSAFNYNSKDRKQMQNYGISCLEYALELEKDANRKSKSAFFKDMTADNVKDIEQAIEILKLNLE